MTKLKCIAVDDEHRALEIIEGYIEQVPFLDCIATFRNPLKAFTHLKSHEVDLLFLDINMPNLSGIEFIKTLSNRPMIILTTAYSEYAVESYGLDVLDYLLKPIEFNRFFKAVNKALDQSGPAQTNTAVDNEKSAPVFIKDGNQLVKVDVQEVVLVEASGNYQKVHTSTGNILSLIPMDELLTQFGYSGIVRVHKSYAVNIHKIDSIENHRIRIGDKIIPIGETYRNHFYNRIK